ncbi:extracellular solute-binding protein [Paenibacillus nasutitermitis]|uniref:ABC transporter substrate-binding protein n=1 Tax=Paenibacillus nasutitermitis TaxID=1652958 RepID=A0A916YK48_9BACL|nr:extracellular solute-binding protein [Paenibacillus nasutitermitis]GGD49239.1 ABC transporter substrate-binding protein [Paenibacillus nasutitermitis]
MTKTRTLKGFMVVSVLLVLLFVVACSNNGNSTNGNKATNGADDKNTSQNNSSKTIVLKALTSKHPYQADWNTMLVFKEREKNTNVVVNWENIGEGYVEKRNLILASNDVPDFIARSSLSAVEIDTYAKQGIIIGLNDLIDNHAPNLKAVLDENPRIRKAITSADGNIYALPVINGWMGDNTRKLWVKQTWLDELKLSTPTTLDEFTDVLRAFRKKGPDVVPMYISASNARQYFAGSFGLGTKGSDNFIQYGFDLDASGNIRFVKTDPNYKELLKYLNLLWNEKLLSPTMLNDKEENHVSLANAGLVGAFMSHNAEPHKPDDFDMVAPFKSEFTDHPLLTTFNSGVWQNQVVLTNANKHPEETMEWLDYWYSEQGWIEMQYGFKGVTYEVDADGGYWWTPEYDHLVQPIEKSRGQFSPMFGLGLPYYIVPDEMTKRRPWKKEMLEAAAITRIDEAVKRFEPYTQPVMANGVDPFMFTSEENTIVKSFQAEAMQYAEEMEVKFILGQESFNNWDNYVKKLEGMGLDRYMEVLNAANERYKKL